MSKFNVGDVVKLARNMDEAGFTAWSHFDRTEELRGRIGVVTYRGQVFIDGKFRGYAHVRFYCMPDTCVDVYDGELELVTDEQT